MKESEEDIIRKYEEGEREYLSSEDTLNELGITIEDLESIDLEDIEKQIKLEEKLEEDFKGNLAHLEDMSDDEAILELDKIYGKNDKIIETDYLSSLIQQNSSDKIVYYEVENIYSNESKRRYKNKLKLKNSPPVLIIKDDDGNEASFILTENLTDELSDTLKQVKRSYLGFNGPEDLNMPDNFIGKIGYYARNNPLKILFPLVLLFIIGIAFL